MDWNTLPHTQRQALFGGEGTVRIWDLLGTGQAPPFSAVLRCELEPGGSVGPHRQQRDPEILVGLEGTGQVTVDRQSAPFGPGSLIYLPHGGVLSITNRSDDAPLRYFIIKAQAQQTQPG